MYVRLLWPKNVCENKHNEGSCNWRPQQIYLAESPKMKTERSEIYSGINIDVVLRRIDNANLRW